MRSPIPLKHILLVLDEIDLLNDPRGLEQFRRFVQWCHELNIDTISAYISVIRAGMKKEEQGAARDRLSRELQDVLRDLTATLTIYGARTGAEAVATEATTYFHESSTNGRQIIISLGFTGRSELTNAARELAEQVKAGKLEPDEINEQLIESELLFKSEPDLVIRSGSTHLMDFLIWQSVYTEFYFTDMNWVNFRKIDLLRAVRDFQLRERRFGR
ncbi:MAG: undecaprenyl diphosphate synthase family protein [Methanomicrobia archaeon]|nr:undecaprenyl diphosphate synthase family protein [Methanomicrobia archaeon]